MIIVPTVIKRKSLVCISSLAITAVPGVFIICLIFRKIFRVLNNDKHQDIGHIFLDNLSAFLSVNSSIPIHSRHERILHIFILLASMILTMMISAFLFGNLLVKDTIYGIDTLQVFIMNRKNIRI